MHCIMECGKLVRVGQYQEHLKGACRSHYTQLGDSTSKVTISEVLATSPATPAEVKVAKHLVTKIMDQSSSSDVFQIPTRGQVSTMRIQLIIINHTLVIYK